VFFYGSFINRRVLAEGGLVVDEIEPAKLWGFDILIETLATLVRSDRDGVYGIVCQATHAQLAAPFGQHWLGGTYLPEPVLVELFNGRLTPALCYIAKAQPPERPDDDYIDRITGPAQEFGFPGWYIERLKRFQRPRGESPKPRT
jgi:hypothetical protein